MTVFGRCEETAGTEPFDRLIHQRDVLLLRLPAGCAGSPTTAPPPQQVSINRLEDRWPTLRLIHLPVHA